MRCQIVQQKAQSVARCLYAAWLRHLADGTPKIQHQREEGQQEQQPEEAAGLANWLTGAAWLCLLPQFSQCQCHSVCCMPQHNFLRVCVCVCVLATSSQCHRYTGSQPAGQAGRQATSQGTFHCQAKNNKHSSVSPSIHLAASWTRRESGHEWTPLFGRFV